VPRSLTLSELVELYLAQHDVQPMTIAKLPSQLVAKLSREFKPFLCVGRTKRLPLVAPALFHNCSIRFGAKRAV
jgi:hypothetical protein